MSPGRHHEQERGATAVLVAILIGVLCAFVALVINSGHLMSVRGQLQNATDAAALAGVRELNGTVDGLNRAKSVAAAYAQRHITDKDVAVVIDGSPESDDVVIGVWDFAAPRESAFAPLTELTPAALAAANAVLVRAGREESRENAVAVTMGGLLGKEKADVRASSVAVMGGPANDPCPLIPLAFSSCAVTELDGTPLCDKLLTFHSDNNDTIGFTNLAPDASVDTRDLRDILKGSCRPVHVGNPISISNGTNLQPLVDLWPLNTPVQAPVVDVPECKFVSHDGTKILGFLTVTITDVKPAPDLSITVEVDCHMSSVLPSTGGGTFFGTTATQPLLVR